MKQVQPDGWRRSVAAQPHLIETLKSRALLDVMDITLSNCDPKSVTVDLYGPTYSVLRLRRSGDVVCTATISAAVIPSDGRGGPARGLGPAKPEF